MAQNAVLIAREAVAAAVVGVETADPVALLQVSIDAIAAGDRLTAAHLVVELEERLMLAGGFRPFALIDGHED